MSARKAWFKFLISKERSKHKEKGISIIALDNRTRAQSNGKIIGSFNKQGGQKRFAYTLKEIKIEEKVSMTYI